MNALNTRNPSPANKTTGKTTCEATEGHQKNGGCTSSYEKSLPHGIDFVKNARNVRFNSEYTDTLLRLGYEPFPINGKIPFPGFLWKDCVVTQENIDFWKIQYENAGIALKYQPAVDMDIYDRHVAEAMREWFMKRFGVDFIVLVRVGQKPKFLIPVRGDFDKKMISDAFGTAEGGISRIEVLSTQQYWVALGIHPGTQAPYEWTHGSILNTPPDQLPLLTEDDVLEIFQVFRDTCNLYGAPLYRKAAPERDMSYANAITQMDRNTNSAVDKFKNACDLAALMIEAGFTPTGTTGQTPYGPSTHYTRPGKDHGPSVGLLEAVDDIYPPGLYVWSTEAGFPHTDKFYNAFGVLGHLFHQQDGGEGPDWKAAAKDVRSRGFQDDIDEEDFADLNEDKGTDQATFRRLAELSAADYDRVRVEEADHLGIRVPTLDTEVNKYRQSVSPFESEGSIMEIEPWPEPIEGGRLLDEIYTTIMRYVVLPSFCAVAISLWVILSYVFDVFRICPKLLVSSPTKRCGKSTLLEILLALVFRGLSAANCSPAAMFRAVEQLKPTLLIDEFDSFLSGNDELRGIINSGHTRSSAFVLRVNPDTLQVEHISTWGAQALFGIGNAPDTVKDRSIESRLLRKLPEEKVEKVPLDLNERNSDLRRKAKRWADDNAEALRNTEPANVTEVGNDRAIDNWTPLIAIADTAGDEWPERARSSMEAIELKDGADNSSISEKLLVDIRDILDGYNDNNILSATLVSRLNEIDGRPWSEWRRGHPLSTNSLSRLLSPYGLVSRTVRVNPTIDKNWPVDQAKGPDRGVGYVVAQFGPIFERYLGPRNHE